MEKPQCSFDGCTNQRKHVESGLCLTHRRMQVRGEPLKLLYRSPPQSSLICTGPDCDRPAEAKSLCKGHGRQLRQAGELWAFGDRERSKKARRRRWDNASPEEKRKIVDTLVNSRPRHRTTEHSARQSVSLRGSWERKYAAMLPVDVACHGCEQTFTLEPKVGAQFAYCSIECRKQSYRLAKYGLRISEFNKMLEQQNDLCGLCKQPWGGYNSKADTPHIDHCHDTGRVRGLLCGNCNTAIGRFGDDPIRLRNAADYLERASG